MMNMRQVSQILINEGRIKLYEGELGQESFFSWLKYVGRKAIKKIIYANNPEVQTFRLISNAYFFPEDYIDISMDVVPQVGQKIKVKGIEGAFMVIRKSDQDKEYELLKKEEGLVHSSELISRAYLKERYPYLMYPSDKAYSTCQLLEVIDVISMDN